MHGEQDGGELRAAIAQAEWRAANAEARVAALEADVRTLRRWMWWSLAAIVVTACVALIVLGAVAFNAIDDNGSR